MPNVAKDRIGTGRLRHARFIFLAVENIHSDIINYPDTKMYMPLRLPRLRHYTETNNVQHASAPIPSMPLPNSSNP
jgi:hypothetical protein